MNDPKKTIEKLTRISRNPENAAALERIETNEKLGDIHNETKVHNDHLKNIADKLETHKEPLSKMNAFLEAVKGEKGEQGEKGNDGYTPQKGIDYFLEEEVEKFLNRITPQKGVHYFNGENGLNGIDGKDADEEKIIQTVLSKIPKPKDGKDGKNGKDAQPLDPKIVVKETIKHLQGLKGNDRPSLKMFRESEDLIGTVALHKNMMSKMPKSLLEGDQRWGGHGVVLNAGSNVSITQNADGSYTISSTSAGFTKLTATGAVDGSNTAFTFIQKPTYIVSDGAWLTQTDNNGGTQWSWNAGTLTATMQVAPINSIYGVA